MGRHSDPIAEQRSAAVRRRRVDGKNGNAHVPLATSTHERRDGRRLARARRTRSHRRCGEARLRPSASSTSPRRGLSTRLSNRPAARVDPLRAASMSSSMVIGAEVYGAGTSMTVADPIPPPRLRSSCTSVTSIRAPVSGNRMAERAAATAGIDALRIEVKQLDRGDAHTDANASLISNKSTSASESRACASAFGIASTGARPVAITRNSEHGRADDVRSASW